MTRIARFKRITLAVVASLLCYALLHIKFFHNYKSFHSNQGKEKLRFIATSAVEGRKTTKLVDELHESLHSKHAGRFCPTNIESYIVHDQWPLLRSTPWMSFTRRQNPRQLILGMMFDCEEWMLEIKLNEIGHLIDRFILVEGAYSLQNTPREQCFPSIAASNDQIGKWLPKITYIYDAEPIQSFKYWEAEVYYRDLIGLRGLRGLDLSDDDLIIVSDLDEIPSDSFLSFLKWHQGFPTLIELRLLWSYYAFSWVNPRPTTARMVSSIGELRDLGANRTNALRRDLFGNKLAWRPQELAGWHCSWCTPTAAFPSKLRHFAHSELRRDLQTTDPAFLARVRAAGLWLADRRPNGCLQSRVQLPGYAERHAGRFPALLGPAALIND